MKEKGRDMDHFRFAFKVARLAAVLGLVVRFVPAQAAEKLVVIGLAVDDAALGNGDGSLEPGETADLKVELYNDGTTAASATGELLLATPAPGVAILDPLATWPTLFARADPRFTDAPHFRVRLDGSFACGRSVPFALRITSPAGIQTVPLPLRVGRRRDHDAAPLPARAYNRPETTFFGGDGGDDLGVAVATGDFNGDGYADAAIGAPNGDSWANGRPNAGEVYVAYGGADRRPDVDLQGVSPGIAGFFGVNAGDGLGARLAAGDFDGDGFDDLLMAADRGAGPGNTRLFAGEISLVYGQQPSWGAIDLAAPPMPVARIWGADPEDGHDNQDFGAVEVATGDLNGDGFDDIILGFDSAASLLNARPRAGEVTILYGHAARYGDVDLAAPPVGTVHLWGAEPDDAFGHSIAAGDVDGDGFDDLLIGAPRAASLGNARTLAGEAYLLRGGPAPLSDQDMAAPGPGVVRIWGGEPGIFEQDMLGDSVAIGDLDGDGRGDVVLGANGADSPGHVRQNAGEVAIVFAPPAAGDLDLNASPAGVLHVWGADQNDQLGGSVGGWGEGLAVGDFDGDGDADLALGARYGDGSANGRADSGGGVVLDGPLAPGSDIDLAAPPPGVMRYWGSDAGDQMGVSLAAGDVDGDGIEDLVLGSIGADGPAGARPESGEASLWFGKPAQTYLARDLPVSPPPNLGEAFTVLPLQCDDCSTPVDLPFPFDFYGQTFTRIHVSSNGFFSFAPINDSGSWLPGCFPLGTDQNGIVAPLWTDLDPTGAPGTAVIRTRVQGIAPARRFAVEWIDVPHYSGGGPSASGATFRAVLYEANGVIQLHYEDLAFASPADDGGLSAAVGLENGAGTQGLSFSCMAPVLPGGGTMRLLQLAPNTPLVESRFEHQDSLWEENPVVWHLNSQCPPASHTGLSARYAGLGTCNDGGTLAARLKWPATPDFPADARVAFWSRGQVDTRFDSTTLDLSNTGPGFGTPVYTVTQNTGLWRYEGIGNLFQNAGDDVDLSFYYNSPAATTPLGWMVDDVQLAGCDGRVDAPGNAFAMAFGTGPATFCQGGTPPRLDSTGSFCLDDGTPVTWQWFENGAPIPGATGPATTTPAGKPPGAYDYTVGIECDDGAADVSAPVPFTIEAPLGAIGDSLRVTTANNGTTLVFTWDALPGASSYELHQDASPSGPYAAVAGAAPAGTLQILVPMPAGNLFFLVAGGNSCGDGALH
jgi:hypothetical protein